MTKPQIDYEYPIYSDHVMPKGHLTLDKRVHACFRYYLLCQKLLETAGRSIDDQIRYDDAEWLDKRYGNIARSVAIQYGLDSPDDFLKSGIKQVVEKEVARLGFPKPDGEYWVVYPGKIVRV